MNRRLVLSVRVGRGDDASDPAAASAIAALAESAGLDLLILGDGASGGSGFDPLILAAWLAPRLPTVGIVPRIAPREAEPFHVARALSALDFLTARRSGWQPSAGDDTGLGRAADFVAATRSLWHSWDADALIIDQARAIYLDPDKVRPSNHRGPFFRVHGPLNAARPPQGEPLLVLDDRDPLARGVPADVLIAATGTADAGPLRLLRLDGAAIDSVAIEDAFRAGQIGGVHLDSIDALRAFAASALPALRDRGLIGEHRPGMLRDRLARASIG